MPYVGPGPTPLAANKDLQGGELILDADNDTTITADTDDQIDIKIAGSDEIKITAAMIAPATADGSALGGTSNEWSDLYLADSAVIGLGADQDVTFTHVADTGVLLNSTRKIQFGDSATFIHQSSDGVMTIDGEATIDLNASTAVLVSNDLKLNSDSAVLGFGADNDVTLTHAADTSLTCNLMVAATTFEPSGDTASGDNAAIGYTNTEGLILTGQGSSYDVTIKNDADTIVAVVPTGADDLRFLDNAKAEFGTGGDLQIYHDGSDSYISDGGTGDLKIGGATNVKIQNPNGSEVMANFAQDGAVTLYHDNSAKFATSAAGATITGDLSLSDGSSVDISTPLLAGADHTATGLTAQMLAGGAISAFDLVCIHTTTGEVVEADASAYSTARVIGIAPAAISDTATGTILLQGFIRDDTWNWTTGSPLYLSETAGAMTHTAPTTDGAFVQVVGVALEPDVVYFNPSMDVIEHA